MEKLDGFNKHIGIFDFFGIFAAGMIIVSSYFVFIQNISLPRLIKLKISIVPFVSVSYAVGQALYVLSSIMIDYSRKDASGGRCEKKIQVDVRDARNQAQESYVVNITSESYVAKKGFCYRIMEFIRKREITRYYRMKYYDNNDYGCLNFEDCNNYNKYHGISDRADKMHAIYGLMRNVSLGYAVILVWFICVHLFRLLRTFFYRGNWTEIHIFEFLNKVLIVFVLFVLVVSFLGNAIKYYYRWKQCVFETYRRHINEKCTSQKVCW